MVVAPTMPVTSNRLMGSRAPRQSSAHAVSDTNAQRVRGSPRTSARWLEGRLIARACLSTLGGSALLPRFRRLAADEWTPGR